MEFAETQEVSELIIKKGAYERSDALVYDVKLDYSSFVNANEKEVKEMLSIELLRSFVVFNSLKITHFDRDNFKRDIACFLKVCGE